MNVPNEVEQVLREALKVYVGVSHNDIIKTQRKQFAEIAYEWLDSRTTASQANSVECTGGKSEWPIAKKPSPHGSSPAEKNYRRLAHEAVANALSIAYANGVVFGIAFEKEKQKNDTLAKKQLQSPSYDEAMSALAEE